MIKHIVMWKLKMSYSVDEKQEIAQTIADELCQLQDLMKGVERIEVIIDVLDTSNMDVMLISEFDTQATLASYQQHPKHQLVGNYIKEKVESRSCIDYLF